MTISVSFSTDFSTDFLNTYYKHKEILIHRVEIAPGLGVVGVVGDDSNLRISTHPSRRSPDWLREKLVATPDLFKAKLVSEVTTRPSQVSFRIPGDFHRGRTENHYMEADSYAPGQEWELELRCSPKSKYLRPYLFGEVEIEFRGEILRRHLKFLCPSVGHVTVEGTDLRVDVEVGSWKGHFYESLRENYPIPTIMGHLRGSSFEGGPETLWSSLMSAWTYDCDDEGLTATRTRKTIALNLGRLKTELPFEFRFFEWLRSPRTWEGVSNNKLLSAFLRAVGEDYDKLVAALRDARQPQFSQEEFRYHSWTDSVGVGKNRAVINGLRFRRRLCESLPGVSDKIREEEAKKDYRKQKTAEGQAAGLGITKEAYPKLFAAIAAGDIPTGVFSQPGDHGAPVNREFLLWEKALSQKGWSPIISEVAKNAASRTTYERDITPWLNALFKWPAFLTKHTKGPKWKAMPKFVQSQWELEMDNEGDEDVSHAQKTRKERSAFTPQVDNETRTVTIPYVAVSVSGVRTQWCYSRNYYLFEEGFTDPVTGGIVVNDLEKNLNGQGDDYGLCFFTLTGTVTARGYPTFLIIFERRDSGATWVHFHRVRPCRITDGHNTPPHQLVERCYQYMAGNVPASWVCAQQGDLIFLRQSKDPLAAKAKVAENPQSGHSFSFESHTFVSQTDDPITLHISVAKEPKNRLGFLHAPGGMRVEHPEHDHLTSMEAGWYEVRRCKSYENNPVGIWSLNID